MIKAMSSTQPPNDKPEATSLGPGNITILNPKDATKPAEPRSSRSEEPIQVQNPQSPQPPAPPASVPPVTATVDPQPPLAANAHPSASPAQGPTPIPVSSPSTPSSIPPVVAPDGGNGAQHSESFGPIPHSVDHACSNCGVKDTPLWRRGLRGEIMCNACGLYVKSRRISRPVNLKRIPRTKTVTSSEENAAGSCPGGGQCNGTGGSQACSKCPTFNNRAARAKVVQQTQQQVLISCQNCGTVTTPLWRRDNEGNTICNACGLYLRMHNEHRPVRMVKNTIKRRKRAGGSEGGESPVSDKEASIGPVHPPASSLPGTPLSMPSGAFPVPPRFAPQVGPMQPAFSPQIHPPIDFTTEGATRADSQIKSELPNYQPLSLLEYLSGDSKKEYLLAVRRQLQDKVNVIEEQHRQLVYQLSQCDEAVKQLD